MFAICKSIPNKFSSFVVDEISLQSTKLLVPPIIIADFQCISIILFFSVLMCLCQIFYRYHHPCKPCSTIINLSSSKCVSIQSKCLIDKTTNVPSSNMYTSSQTVYTGVRVVAFPIVHRLVVAVLLLSCVRCFLFVWIRPKKEI